MADVDWSLLARYAAGECTAGEKSSVEQWLASSPEHGARLSAIRQVAAQGAMGNSARERAQILAEIQRKVAAMTRDVGRGRSLPWQRPARIPWRIAAMLVGLLGASVASYALLRQSPSQGSTGAEVSAARVFSAPRAVRLSLRLPDGTLVELAPATTLQVPAGYGQRDRRVTLNGEAAFIVTHDESKPFTVHTDRLVARDLGTRFVVRAYADELAAEVVVAEGVVAVTQDSSGSLPTAGAVVLREGEGVRVAADSGLTMMQNVALDRYFGWTQGRFVFRSTRLAEAVSELSRWYDIDVRLGSQDLATLPLIASFNHTESAVTVLQMIADALNLRLVRDGLVYTLRQ